MADNNRLNQTAKQMIGGLSTAAALATIGYFEGGGWLFVFFVMAGLIAFMAYYIYTVDSANGRALAREMSRDKRVLTERRKELVAIIEQIDSYLGEE